MQFQTILAALAAVSMGIAPVLAAPEAIPELEVKRDQCIHGQQVLKGSGCAPSRKGKTSCSANGREVVSVSFL